MFQNYIVYISVSSDRRVLSVGNSSSDGKIAVDEGIGDKYHHAESHYFQLPVRNQDKTHNYRYEDGQVRKATDVELAAELAEIQAVNIETVKAAKITDSKTQLAAYLEVHPLTYTDGKQYSVTAEKQSLLTSALARYQIATAAGVQTTLKWNATGEECTVWEYADLAALALAIAAYVEPLVGQQQAAEVAINACSTVAEVEAIVIAYGS